MHRSTVNRRRFLGGVAAAGLAGATASPAATAVAATTPRVELLLARMTLAEKIGQLNMPQVLPRFLIPTSSPAGSEPHRERFVAGTWRRYLGPGGGFFGLMNETVTGAIPVEHPRTPRQQAELTNRLQRIAGRTRLGIPVLQIAEGTNGFSAPGATIFPEGPGLGATWNTELIERVYAAAAAEARSVGVHVLNTLVAEINRDPRFGRVCEYFGEDSHLVSAIIGAVVRGAQGGDVSADNHAVASLCHYPAQTPNVGGLEGSSVELGERQLRQAHLPPWQEGFAEEGALMTLACQATIDGVPTHASEFLLTDVLRDELQFSGVVISEGGGFQTLVKEGLAATQKEAGALALRAGVDVGITWESAYLDDLDASVRDGSVSMELVNRAVRRVLTLKEKLGLFDNPFVDVDRAEKVIHSAAHQDVSLQASRESIVLLKNDHNTLPLSGSVRTIAVIGPNADEPSNMLGDYNPWPPFHPIPSILDCIRTQAPKGVKVTYARGCDILKTDRSGFAKAVEAAKAADAAIVVIGEQPKSFNKPGSTDGEATDMASLDLTGVQDDLVSAVHATGTPTIAVLINGRALSINRIAKTVPAILEAFLPGEYGGQAVAEILFGKENPSGRLPVTVPRSVGQLPMYYDQKRMRAAADGYVDLPATPLYEFGFGLSYTTFTFSNLRLSRTRIRPHERLEVMVDVTNTGKRSGQEVVQLYLEDTLASVSLPAKMLRGFAKVRLEPGHTRTVRMSLRPRELALVDQRMRTVVEPGSFTVMIGSSCTRIELTAGFQVVE